MPDLRLCLEALSAVTGCIVEQTTAASQLTAQDIVNVVALKEFYKQEGFETLEYPSLGSMSLRDIDDVDLYSAPLAIKEGPADATTSPQASMRPTMKINPKDFFDPQYDYDFTNIKDGDKSFTRGREHYVRPCGWNRVALRVVGKYDGGEGWLGTGTSAWPVSYHGNKMDGKLGIILTRRESTVEEPGLLDAAAAALVTEDKTRGRGVYSTPDVKIAEEHCKKFKSQVDGNTYKVVLQNRINPEKRKECQREGYWLVYVPDGTTEAHTRAIVQEALRPYGMLLKRV